MARPKVNVKKKLDKSIPIKFSDCDIDRLKCRAIKDRIAVSTLIRKFVLERIDLDEGK